MSSFDKKIFGYLITIFVSMMTAILVVKLCR